MACFLNQWCKNLQKSLGCVFLLEKFQKLLWIILELSLSVNIFGTVLAPNQPDMASGIIWDQNDNLSRKQGVKRIN